MLQIHQVIDFWDTKCQDWLQGILSHKMGPDIALLPAKPLRNGYVQIGVDKLQATQSSRDQWVCIGDKTKMLLSSLDKSKSRILNQSAGQQQRQNNLEAPW